MTHDPVCERSDFDLDTAAQTSRTTEGANPPLRFGDILTQVCVETPAQAAPIHVTLHLAHFGFVIELKSKWVRGPSDHAGGGALIWEGRLKVGKDPTLFIFARNDTGGTIGVRTHWVLERES